MTIEKIRKQPLCLNKKILLAIRLNFILRLSFISIVLTSLIYLQNNLLHMCFQITYSMLYAYIHFMCILVFQKRTQYISF